MKVSESSKACVPTALWTLAAAAASAAVGTTVETIAGASAGAGAGAGAGADVGPDAGAVEVVSIAPELLLVLSLAADAKASGVDTDAWGEDGVWSSSVEDESSTTIKLSLLVFLRSSKSSSWVGAETDASETVETVEAEGEGMGIGAGPESTTAVGAREKTGTMMGARTCWTAGS